MNKVRQYPQLPRDSWGERVLLQLLDILREFAASINEAADGRLWRMPDTYVTGSYTAGENDLFIPIQPAGTMTLTLPRADLMKGKLVVVKRAANSTSPSVTIATAAGNIDGSATVTLNTAYQRRMFLSDGIQYWEVT